MRKLAAVAGLAGLLLCACQKQTELALESNAVYEKGAPPALPPASVTLESVPDVALPPEEAPVDGAAVAPPDAASPDASAQFPDYKPKTSADTVTDFRPGVAGDVNALPGASDPAALARAFLEWKGRAAASPGSNEAGAQQLGADAQEYKPSDAELVAAEAGDRLSAALNGADEAGKAAAAAVLGTDGSTRAYRRFDYRHVDVMGSGRYFYASQPKSASVPG